MNVTWKKHLRSNGTMFKKATIMLASDLKKIIIYEENGIGLCSVTKRRKTNGSWIIADTLVGWRD